MFWKEDEAPAAVERELEHTNYAVLLVLIVEAAAVEREQWSPTDHACMLKLSRIFHACGDQAKPIWIRKVP